MTVSKEAYDKLLDEACKLRLEVEGLRACRIAYASEFESTEDGEPDVVSIHQNIRKLKKELAGAYDLLHSTEDKVMELKQEAGIYGGLANL